MTYQYILEKSLLNDLRTIPEIKKLNFSTNSTITKKNIIKQPVPKHNQSKRTLQTSSNLQKYKNPVSSQATPQAQPKPQPQKNYFSLPARAKSIPNVKLPNLPNPNQQTDSMRPNILINP